MGRAFRTVLAVTGTTMVVAGGGEALGRDGGRPLSTTLSGAEECHVAGVCGVGDPDGTGTATFRLNPGQERICFTLVVSGIDPATAAHIHKAPPGEPGPVVVGLTAPTDGSSSGCVSVPRATVKAILRDPDAYYVNVHNATYPPGAVRGQL